MKSKNIKKIFDRVFNNMPNPIFCCPLGYFQHKNFLCEVAATMGKHCLKWNNSDFQNKNPLLILEALFVDSGYWITVLERKNRNTFLHREDLCAHIDSEKDIPKFIMKLN